MAPLAMAYHEMCLSTLLASLFCLEVAQSAGICGDWSGVCSKVVAVMCVCKHLASMCLEQLTCAWINLQKRGERGDGLGCEPCD